MNNTGNHNTLSERIERYKAQLESLTIRGMIEEDKKRHIVRVLLEVAPGSPPIYAEVRESDVTLITPEESGKSGSVQIKRGADYVLSMVAVAGLEEDLPAGIRDAVEGTFKETDSRVR